MTPKALIEFFSTFTVVPIDPDDVADQIRKGGSTDEINFVGVKLDIRIMRGAFHQYVRRNALYGEPIVCVDIYYDRDQGEDWRRLVCCKELLHILDHSVSHTVTAADCEKLIDGLINLTKSSDFSAEQISAWTDHLMAYYAIAILFPWDVRQTFVEPFAAHLISKHDIAEKLNLPIQAVDLVMSEAWPGLYKVLSAP